MFVEIHASGFAEIIFVGASLLVIFGHNLWLIGKEEPTRIRVAANTGDDFPESDSAVKPERVADFRIVSPDGSAPIVDYRVEGNSLIADVAAANSRFFCAALALRAHPITLEAAKFGGYIIEEEEAQELVKPNFIAGVTSAPQRESYTKFAKVLLDNGRAETGDVADSVAGHQLEIVPQMSVSEAFRRGKLPIRVLFEGEPIAGLRVSSGCEETNRGRYSAHARTDADGRAEIVIQNRGHCFVRTHFIRPHADRENFDWESFWASITFRI